MTLYRSHSSQLTRTSNENSHILISESPLGSDKMYNTSVGLQPSTAIPPPLTLDVAYIYILVPLCTTSFEHVSSTTVQYTVAIAPLRYLSVVHCKHKDLHQVLKVNKTREFDRCLVVHSKTIINGGM